MEFFWVILKRGIIGQFHKVSDKHLPMYIAEFYYRFNQRDNNHLFYDLILNSIKTTMIQA